jgi:hypothetical protein
VRHVADTEVDIDSFDEDHHILRRNCLLKEVIEGKIKK